MFGEVNLGMWLIGGVASFGIVLLSVEAWLTAQVSGQSRRLRDHLFALEERAETQKRTAPIGDVEAPSVPIVAPSFRLPTAGGDMIELGDLLAMGRPVLLLFTDPRARSAGPLQEVSAWQAEHDDSLTVAVITTAKASDAIQRDRPGIVAVLRQADFAVSRDYGVRFAPAAVLVRAGGVLVGEPVYGMGGIREMLSHLGPAAVEAHASRAMSVGESTLMIGDLAPPLRLPDRNGNEIDLADFLGRPSLVIFWSPRCGYCAQLERDLVAWANDPLPGAPQALVVTRGTAEENAALDIAEPVLLERAGEASSAYGVLGTPTAILLDAEGRIAAAPARGIRGVRALVGLDAPAAAQPIIEQP